MNKCRACEYTSEIHKAAVEREIQRLSEMKSVKKCGDEEFNRRLEICDKCRRCDINGTCMMCGCYIQIRAFLKDSRCPVKRW